MSSSRKGRGLPTLEEEQSDDLSTQSWRARSEEGGEERSVKGGDDRSSDSDRPLRLSRHGSVGIIRAVHSDVAYDSNSAMSDHSDSIRSTEDPITELKPPSRTDDMNFDLIQARGNNGASEKSLSDSFQKSREMGEPSDLEESSESSTSHSYSRAASNTQANKDESKDDNRRTRNATFGRSSLNMSLSPPPPPRRRASENPSTKPRLNAPLSEHHVGIHRQGSAASRASNGSTSSAPGNFAFGRNSGGGNSGQRSSQRAPSSTPPSSFTASLMRRSNALSRKVKSTAYMNYGIDEDDALDVDMQDPASVYRGYNVGDPCLLGNLEWGSAPAGGGKWSSLVNRYGFPPDQGSTPEEQRGPYAYVFAIVKQVNFEEFVAYYTVTRIDTGQHVRGEAENMIPLNDEEGITAARAAAEKFANGEEVIGEENGEDGLDSGNIHTQDSKAKRCLEGIVVTILFPFFCLFDCFVDIIGFRLLRWGKQAYRTLHREFHYLLNGSGRYYCTFRLTITNFLVMCSIWFMLIDQARLAFFPAESDFSLAIVNFIVWVILMIELLLEMFIRPTGYQTLIVNEKAFSPATVRYICAFHLTAEFIGLGFFIPEFLCLFTGDQCDGRPKVSLLNASLLAVTGPTRANVFAGRLYFACLRFRVFGCVRHWKNMWIRRTFLNNLLIRRGAENDESPVPYTAPPADTEDVVESPEVLKIQQKSPEEISIEQRQREVALSNASNIGTALMVTNSYRSLTIFWFIVSIFPVITINFRQGVADLMPMEQVQQLQAVNLLVDNVNDGGESCDFFATSVGSWVYSLDQRNRNLITTESESFLFSLAIQPSRCLESVQSALVGGFNVFESDCSRYQDGFQINNPTGQCLFITPLANFFSDTFGDLEEMAEAADIRLGAIRLHSDGPVMTPFVDEDGNAFEAPFSVYANFNQTFSIETAALAAFLLQICLLVSVISSLLLFRHDAENLVLGPLRNMLKIVARYAKNPLTPARQVEKASSADDASHSSLGSEENAADAFGSYETEQLITAVSKITDLLRKCWGVAGADIISTNLASQEGALSEVFNPTVPGQSVYALFAFAAIDGFDHALKCLGGDVMILINDVAAVLHDEVFRWGFGDSGQCNKNLGAAFLMVFRIGLVKEVEQKLKEATNVIFSTKSSSSSASKRSLRKRGSSMDSSRPLGVSSHHTRNSSGFEGKLQRLAIAKNAAQVLKSNHQQKKRDAIAEALSLKSLPGISTFTDLAVIGMLKSFAGIHRDKKLRDWSTDFRLSAGIGSFSVSMIFGMDAGWAVEGAVGSEYKIDATYLSPHVNMAARMMSACKHYGVTILLSEAVQELMSTAAKAKLRNLDRVTVKGSTRIQKIFTYDARHTGADFFLFSRSNEQADMEAERYTPNIWTTDQDLKAMRHHVTEDFEQEFNAGLKAYLQGKWPLAIDKLEKANEIMVEAAMEEGYLHDELDDTPNRKELYRSQTADGPSVYLVNFMKSKSGVAPEGWNGWHPLLSK